MAVAVRPNPYHPARDVAVLTDPWTAEELRTAACRNDRPLSQKAVPGTDRHAKLLASGGHIYQQCPPLQVDASTPEIRDWCRDNATLTVQSLHGLDVLELWTSWYETIHRGWSPTAPHQQLLDLFGDLAAEIDLDRSSVCQVEAVTIAAAFVFSDDQPPEILPEALLPEHPQARAAVASCMATALLTFDGPVRFDGHLSDPHFDPLWRTVPGTYAGPTDPLDLIEIPNA